PGGPPYFGVVAVRALRPPASRSQARRELGWTFDALGTCRQSRPDGLVVFRRAAIHLGGDAECRGRTLFSRVPAGRGGRGAFVELRISGADRRYGRESVPALGLVASSPAGRVAVRIDSFGGISYRIALRREYL